MSSNEQNSDLAQEQALRYTRQDILKFVLIFGSFVVAMIILAISDQRTGFLTSWASSLIAKIGVTL